MQQDHHIQTANLEISISRVAESSNQNQQVFRLQNRLLDKLQNKALPKLEPVFNQFCKQPDELIVIDRLEVDLTATNIADFENDFSDLLVIAVRKALSQLPPAIQRKQSQQRSITSVFFHFIKTGRFPWNADIRTLDALEEVMIKRVKQISDLRLLLSIADVRKRIATQFTDAFFEQVILNTTDAPDVLLKYFKVIKKVLKKKHSVLTELMKDWILIQLETDKNLLEKNVKSVTKSLQELDIRSEKESIDWFEKNVLRNKNVKLTIFDKLTIGAKNQGSVESLKSKNGISKFDERTNEDDLKNEQTIFLSFTGLVLMTPFLKSMFEELDLLDNNDFKTKGDQEKAVHLLYYMCTGKTKPDEIATTFFKLICGMKIHNPIRKNIVLSIREKEEVNTCLNAAINHWKVLKNTSPEGLQEGFLNRDGKIVQKDDHWKLTVEPKTIDILLKDIPWSYTVVKLPWMSKMIFVDWVS